MSWNIGQNLENGSRLTIIPLTAFIPRRGIFLKIFVGFIERDDLIIFAFLKGHCGSQVEKRINGTRVEDMTKQDIVVQ